MTITSLWRSANGLAAMICAARSKNARLRLTNYNWPVKIALAHSVACDDWIAQSCSSKCKGIQMKFAASSAFLLVAASLLLSACNEPAPPAKPVVQRPDRDPTAAVIAIRAAGAKLESAVEVKPLRDPAVDGLLKQARDLEAQGQPAAALEAVRKAQKINANAPDIVQYEAELLIETRDWKAAAANAQKSYDLGPKVGALCARNQQTLVEARAAQGDTAGADQARLQVSACNVPAPARY
jgi:tetratricopeptide (TPR) repeat protein